MSPKAHQIPLLKSRPTRITSAMLHVISLAQLATAYTGGWAADSANTRLRLKARVDQLEQTAVSLGEGFASRTRGWHPFHRIDGPTMLRWNEWRS